MVSYLTDIVTHYFSTEVFRRSTTLNYHNNLIRLDSSYPHYEKGIRGVESVRKSYTIYVDLNFFNFFDLSVIKPDSHYDLLTFIVTSNELNLEYMTINFPHTINKSNNLHINLFFDIDMSNHYLEVGSNSYEFSEYDFINWYHSGVNLRLSSYLVEKSIYLKADLSEFLEEINCFLSIDGPNGLSLDNSHGEVIIELYYEMSGKAYYDCMEFFKSFLNSLVNKFVLPNKKISFKINLQGMSNTLYRVSDWKFLNSFSQYFDYFNYNILDFDDMY